MRLPRLLSIVGMLLFSIAVGKASYGVEVYAYATDGYYFADGRAWTNSDVPGWASQVEGTLTSNLGGYDNDTDGNGSGYSEVDLSISGSADTSGGICAEISSEHWIQYLWVGNDYDDYCADEAPTIYGINYAGSGYIEIYGTGLTATGGSTVVKIDGNSASVTYSSSTQVNAYQAGLAGDPGLHTALLITSVAQDDGTFTVP